MIYASGHISVRVKTSLKTQFSLENQSKRGHASKLYFIIWIFPRKKIQLKTQFSFENLAGDEVFPGKSSLKLSFPSKI